jgi:hypothetical protein
VRRAGREPRASGATRSGPPRGWRGAQARLGAGAARRARGWRGPQGALRCGAVRCRASPSASRSSKSAPRFSQDSSTYPAPRRRGGGAPPPPRAKWTRRVPHPVLIGHVSSSRLGCVARCGGTPPVPEQQQQQQQPAAAAGTGIAATRACLASSSPARAASSSCILRRAVAASSQNLRTPPAVSARAPRRVEPQEPLP